LRHCPNGQVDCPDEFLDVCTPPNPGSRTPDPSPDTVHTPAEPTVHTPDSAPGTVRAVPGTGEQTPEHLSVLARRLCARDRAGRRDPDLVTQILTLHHIEGLNPTQIAERVAPSRTTVSRIISEARHLNVEG